MQAIFTKFLPATTHRNDRIRVICGNGRTKFTFNCDGRISHYENHRRAVQSALRALEWYGKWIAGGYENGWVWVRVPGKPFNKLFVQSPV